MVCDQRDFNGALRIKPVLKVVEAYGYGIEDFEKIMIFERIFREEREKYKDKDGS